MAKVYQLYSDGVQSLNIDESSTDYYDVESSDEGGAWFFYDGLPKTDVWKPVTFYVREPLLPRPHIWNFNDVLLLEESAYRVLREIIDIAGEVHEQPFENRMLYLFHVLGSIDALDGDDDWPEEGLSYHLDRVEHSIFRIEDGDLRVVSGHTSPELDFKNVVESNNLTGLIFRKVWDSESGAPPTTMGNQECPPCTE